MKLENIEERQAKRKRSAVNGVVFFTLLQVACALSFGALCLIPELPGWCVVLFGVLAVGCLLLIIPAAVMILSLYFQSRLVALAGLALAFAYGVLRTSIWKCPHCGEYLGKDVGSKCPHCHEKLDL